jgi:NitT/TauT family transport system ATP-binding protein
MVDVQAITFGYGGPVPVFERFSWRVGRGEVWGVLGPSACGKSTLLSLLAGLVQPQAGAIVVEGARLRRPRPRTGLILQAYGLLPWATLRDNVALGLRIRRFYGPDGRHVPRDARIAPEAVRARVEPWLRRLGIAAAADQYPGQVSGGQRQRAAIARTLVLEPDLLLMDEPFAALDAPTREALQALTLRLCAEFHITAVLVTHNIEEAAFMGQQVLLLHAPPNREAHVLPNPHRADAAYRASAACTATCTTLRQGLER